VPEFKKRNSPAKISPRSPEVLTLDYCTLAGTEREACPKLCDMRTSIPQVLAGGGIANQLRSVSL